MTQLQGAEKAEYQEITNQIKREFKEKMQDAINTEKRLMAKEAAELLGRDFADLVNERKQLIAQFSAQSRKVLTFAIQIGLKDKITELSQVIKDKSGKTTAETKKTATALFANVLDMVEEHDEDMVEYLRSIERRLASNNKAMTDLVASRKTEIEQIEKKYKQKLQKILIEIVLDFNKRLAVINKEFGVVGEKLLSPMGEDTAGDLKITIGEDSAEGFFIPTDSDDVN